MRIGRPNDPGLTNWLNRPLNALSQQRHPTDLSTNRADSVKIC
jgi:hypothetical protein